MTVTSLSDLYFISLGLFSYNIIFDVLTETGLIYLPFIMMMLESLYDGMESSKNMSDTAFTLKAMEVKIYSAIIAYSLAVYPAVSFSLDNVSQYVRQCDVDGSQISYVENMNDILSTGGVNVDSSMPTSRKMLINISGYGIEMPILLKAIFKLGTGSSLYAVKKLPCTINMVGIAEDLMNSRIKDIYLKVETKEFIKQCYNRAKNLAVLNQDLSMQWFNDPGELSSLPWPGHRDFMNSAYYGNENLGMYSNLVLDGYESYYEQEKKPTCREWWQGKGAGKDGKNISEDNSLRTRLLNGITDGKLATQVKLLVSGNTYEPRDDQLLKAYYFNPISIQNIISAEVKDYGNETEGVSGWIGDKISRGLGTLGLAADAIPAYAGASLIQISAPIAKGILLLVILALLPIGFIVSKYSFKFVVSVHFFIFSVLMWPFLWDLAILVQQSYIEETMSDTKAVMVDMITQPNVMLISKKLTDALFLGFPVMLTSLLTAAGLAGGQALGSLGGSPGADVGSAGKGGGKMAMNKARSAYQKTKKK